MSVSGEESVKSTKRTIAIEMFELFEERTESTLEMLKANHAAQGLMIKKLEKEQKELQKGQKKGKKEKEKDEHGNVIKKPQSAQLGPWGGFSKRILALLKTVEPTVTSTAANRVGKLVCLPKRATPKTALTQEDYDSITNDEMIECYNEWKELPFEDQYEKKEKKGKKSASTSASAAEESSEESSEEEESSQPNVARPSSASQSEEKPEPKPAKKESKPKVEKPAKVEKPKEEKPAKVEKPKPAKEEKPAKVEKPAKESSQPKVARTGSASQNEEKPKPTRPVMSDTEKDTIIYKEQQYVKQKIQGKEYVTFTNEGELYCYDENENYYGKYNKKTKKIDGSVKDPFTVAE